MNDNRQTSLNTNQVDTTLVTTEIQISSQDNLHTANLRLSNPVLNTLQDFLIYWRSVSFCMHSLSDLICAEWVKPLQTAGNTSKCFESSQYSTINTANPERLCVILNTEFMPNTWTWVDQDLLSARLVITVRHNVGKPIYYYYVTYDIRDRYSIIYVQCSLDSGMVWFWQKQNFGLSMCYFVHILESVTWDQKNDRYLLTVPQSWDSYTLKSRYSIQIMQNKLVTFYFEPLRFQHFFLLCFSLSFYVWKKEFFSRV